MSNDWLKKILEDTAQRVAQKPEWARSDYAQHELARLKAEAAPGARMTTDDAMVAALLTAAAQMNLALEHSKDRKLDKIAYRLHCATAWLNAAIAIAALETVAIEEGDVQS
jgi:hypothetical protein